MICDDCIHAGAIKNRFNCDCKLDPRVPYVMTKKTICPLYKKVEKE